MRPDTSLQVAEDIGLGLMMTLCEVPGGAIFHSVFYETFPGLAAYPSAMPCSAWL